MAIIAALSVQNSNFGMYVFQPYLPSASFNARRMPLFAETPPPIATCFIPAFFTATGVGTVVAEGKEVREFNGKQYIMERAIAPDVSLVKAYMADRSGNLVFRKTARNFNPNVAQAGKVTVVEVEKLVDVGELDPDQIHLPGIFVHRIVLNENPEKRIEQRTTR